MIDRHNVVVCVSVNEVANAVHRNMQNEIKNKKKQPEWSHIGVTTMPFGKKTAPKEYLTSKCDAFRVHAACTHTCLAYSIGDRTQKRQKIK